MPDPASLFGLLGALGVAAAIVVSFGEIAKKLASERRLLARMEEDPEFRRLVLDRREVMQALAQDPPDPRYLSLARAMIEAEVDELDARDRKRILYPLRQASLQGQRYYVRRLLRKMRGTGSPLQAG